MKNMEAYRPATDIVEVAMMNPTMTDKNQVLMWKKRSPVRSRQSSEVSRGLLRQKERRKREFTRMPSIDTTDDSSKDPRRGSQEETDRCIVSQSRSKPECTYSEYSHSQVVA